MMSDIEGIISGGIIFIIGLGLAILGKKLVNGWDKRVANWKQLPSSDEYAGALLQGWGGCMLMFNGVLLSLPSFVIFMLSLVRELSK